MTPVHHLKSRIAIAITLAFAGASHTYSYAVEKSEPPSAKTISQYKVFDQEKSELLAKKREKIAQEAREAIIGTQNALVALKKNDTQKARAQLQDVLGKLDILLTKYPRLELIPADVSAQVYNLENSYEQVKAMTEQAEDLLDDHRIQDARQILDALVSEIRVTTINVPLGTYPAAIKQAVVDIDANKPEQAKRALENVLSMLVNTTEIFSLPVLQAESLLTAASELEHKSDLSKETSRQEILKLTNAAKTKLKLTEILGYGVKEDYQSLYKNIDAIADVVHSKESASTWKHIKLSMAALKEKIERQL